MSSRYGAWLLPRLVGTPRALEMHWTGASISGSQAEGTGLVNRALPATTLVREATAVARRVADAPPLSVRTIKSLVRHGRDLDLMAALQLAAANMPVVRSSEDHREAVAAFRDKRAPRFTGR